MNYEHYMNTNTFKPSKPKRICANCYHTRMEHTGPHEFCPAIVCVPEAAKGKELDQKGESQ